MKQSLRNQVVCFGEVLWDVLPSGELPGGAPMNVTYHLNKLGSTSSLITRIGHDDHGKRLVDLMSATGIPTEYVDVDYDYATGLVYANVNQDHEVSYDFVTPSAWDFIQWKDDYVPLLNAAEFFVYGSLAARSKTSRETLSQLLEMAKTKVFDINLRAPHFQKSSVEYLLARTDILKMNLTELELISGWFSQFQSIRDRLRLIQDRFKIPTVIVTMGANGALVNDRGTDYLHPGFRVSVADTIGSGDSFLAGFLHMIQQQESIEDALDYASMIGAYVATQPGGCPDYDPKQIKSVIHSDSSPSTMLF
jgi:fructokinase